MLVNPPPLGTHFVPSKNISHTPLFQMIERKTPGTGGLDGKDSDGVNTSRYFVGTPANKTEWITTCGL